MGAAGATKQPLKPEGFGAVNPGGKCAPRNVTLPAGLENQRGLGQGMAEENPASPIPQPSALWGTGNLWKSPFGVTSRSRPFSASPSLGESCLDVYLSLHSSLSFPLFLFLFFSLIFPPVVPKSRLHVRSYRIHKSFAPCAAFLKGLEAAPGNLRVPGEGHFQRNGDFHPPAFPLHPCKPHPPFPGKPGGDFGRGCRSQDKFPAEFGDIPGGAAPSPRSGDAPRGCWDLMSGMRWTKGGNSWGIAASGTSRPRCCSCHPF